MSLFKKKHDLPTEVENAKKLSDELGVAAVAALVKVDELMDEYRAAERQIRQRQIDRRR